MRQLKAELKSIENSFKRKDQVIGDATALLSVINEIDDEASIQKAIEKWERKLCREEGM